MERSGNVDSCRVIMSARPPARKKGSLILLKIGSDEVQDKYRIFWNISGSFCKKNFKLEIEFFWDFAKKVANVPKYSKFICPELHLSQFSAKLEELF